MNNENDNTNTDDNTVVEEWVDGNVINPEENDDPNDSVTDCCCDKRKTYDNHNYCIKIPKEALSVSEAIAVSKILLELMEYMPSLSYCYDDYNKLQTILNEYISDCLHILYDENCLENKGDITYHGDKI